MKVTRPVFIENDMAENPILSLEMQLRFIEDKFLTMFQLSPIGMATVDA